MLEYLTTNYILKPIEGHADLAGSASLHYPETTWLDGTGTYAFALGQLFRVFVLLALRVVDLVLPPQIPAVEKDLAVTTGSS
jgi:hypothetical protein